ncbi:MAG: CCC motif membrane protein [Polaribacter sp.]|nr:CCC motif membrane protein [Polaribacter sp.]MDG1812174.1 CCC motif membrane protein [Polaribacter sp.]MDG1994161.1 CCC motif membrane protein [Polaribacter sp.]
MNKELKPTIVYVLASISVICCCFGGLGILFAAPAFIIANKRLKSADGSEYDYKSMNSAKIFALVLLIINGLHLLYTIYFFSNFDYWSEFLEGFREGLESQQ